MLHRQKFKKRIKASTQWQGFTVGITRTTRETLPSSSDRIPSSNQLDFGFPESKKTRSRNKFKKFKKKLKRTHYLYEDNSAHWSSSDEQDSFTLKMSSRIQFKSNLANEVADSAETTSIKPQSNRISRKVGHGSKGMRVLPGKKEKMKTVNVSCQTNENLNTQNLINLLGKELAIIEKKNGGKLTRKLPKKLGGTQDFEQSDQLSESNHIVASSIVRNADINPQKRVPIK